MEAGRSLQASSQIGLDMERHVYEKCRQLKISVISVGHRDSLRQFHDVELHINTSDSSWELRELQHAAVSKRLGLPLLPFVDFDA